MVRRTRVAALLTLAVINVFTLVAGLAVVRMLPPRLAALEVASVAGGPVVGGGAVLTGGTRSGALPTSSGLRSALAGPLSAAALGPQVSAMVADPSTGRILLSEHGSQPSTPASTAKLATAAAALAALGPGARFATRVVSGATADSIILVGGGDPTLAVNQFPAQDYPRPATLAGLAAATAQALTARGHRTVSLSYDTSLYTGPLLAPGWPASYVSTGDVTSIVPLEVDQGRLTPAGLPEDSDDPYNLRPRATDPALMAAESFASLLAVDGIHVTGSPAAQAGPARAAVLASVTSPPLSAIVEQMLQESNNVIAENLARQVALAAGRPALFSGAAQAVISELRRLGVSTGISMVDGSGLSPADAIAPDTLIKILELAVARPGLRSVLAGLPVAWLLRHAVRRRERVQRDHRPGPRVGAGQDRQPEHGDRPGRAGLRRQRPGAGLRPHGRPDPVGWDADPGGGGHRRGRGRAGGMRVPVTAATRTTYGWTVSECYSERARQQWPVTPAHAVGGRQPGQIAAQSE